MEKIIFISLALIGVMMFVVRKRPTKLEDWGEDVNTYLGIVLNYHYNYFPNIEPALVMAIMEAESSFNPNAYRFEAKINDASYGLMQVLYKTALWLGYEGKPEGLYNPETNIYYGMKYIQWLIEKELPLEGVIHAYNVGYGGYLKGRRNNLYTSKVLEYLEYWRLYV